MNQEFCELIERLGGNPLVVKSDEGGDLEVTFEMHGPASTKEIEKLEQLAGFSLPASYKAFLLQCNGGKIFNCEELDGFELMGTGELLEQNRLTRSIYEEWPGSLVMFAEYIGEGSFACFKVEESRIEYKVLDCFHEVGPDEWSVVAESFEEWLAKIVRSNGKKYWLER